MKQKTEYQVVLNDGEDVLTALTKAEAEEEFNKNPRATELRKVIWRISDDDTWETAGDGEREDITIKERG